jgi:Spx/MgsR family transcriptional regulator
MYKLFGIPNCDTVKKARTFLQNKNVEFEFVDFKKYLLTEQDLDRWSKIFGSLPVNNKGVTYKKYKEHFESLKLKDQILFLQNNTSMIKRPILEKEGAVLAFGFDEPTYKKIFP